MSFENIIIQVKAHPELWQTSHECFNHRSAVNRAWTDIATQLNTSEERVKKRWKHLKDQYRKEVKKILSNQITKCCWQYYNDMSFISSQIVNSRTYNRRQKAKSNDTTDADTDSDGQTTAIRAKKEFTPDPLQPTKVTKAKIPKTAAAPKRLYLKSSLKEIKELILMKNRSADEDFKQRNDPDYLFLMSLLPTLRRLNHIQKLQFRGKVNDWLIEAVMTNDFDSNCDDKMFVQEQFVEQSNNSD